VSQASEERGETGVRIRGVDEQQQAERAEKHEDRLSGHVSTCTSYRKRLAGQESVRRGMELPAFAQVQASGQ
jgi:hypothetical protein